MLEGPSLKFQHPISLGFDFWDIVEEEDFASERNGMNLLSIPDTFGLEDAIPEKSCLLAVAMSTRTALSLEQRFGLTLLPIGLIAASANWRFLGYDVTAPGGLTSALYGFDWSKLTDPEKSRFPRGQGNEFGLLEDERQAGAFARFFNDDKLDHSPYYPMGLWVKERTSKRTFFTDTA
ncbi:MAG: hypothetical protein R3D51_17050 [Hyphomicrobiaceae bacterium]